MNEEVSLQEWELQWAGRDVHDLKKELDEMVARIQPLNERAMAAARRRQDYLAKPPKSLGALEDMSVRLAGISGEIKNRVKKQAIVIMCADNGVVEEGVASAPQSVTLSQTINFTKGITGVSSMARYFGIDLLVMDMGVAMDIPKGLYESEMVQSGRISEKIINRSMGKGTKNFAKENAMSIETVLRCLLTGIQSAQALASAGVEVMGIGEMGIGNTSTSSALLCSLTDTTGVEAVGRGGGLNDQGLNKKIEIVDKVSKECRGKDILEILARIGGFDIVAMAGAYIGAAIYRLPVVIDGFISAIAALVASRIAPLSKEFMFPSHMSKEPGYQKIMKELSLQPMVNLGMHLGEGSGCPIAFKVLEAATATMNLMYTLDEGGIDAEYLEEIREKNLI